MSTHPIPNAALDDRLAFLGLGGSGKTYNAGVAVERLLDQKSRVCIVDPLGAWWGLRLKANGKQPSGYNVLIFGGPHGDFAITEHSGALIGETVAGMAESCILDLSELGSDAAERRFMLAFFTALYKHQSKSLLHLIIDEADMWAPQQIFDKEGGAAQLVGKMQNIVRRGRIKGFIPWLITQRPAVLNWGVLSQVTGIVAFTLTASQDREAIGKWVKGEANKTLWNEIWEQLPELPVGSGLVWVPRRKVFGVKAFPQKKTFDSSRAPKRGERRATKKLKPLNVDKLKERFAAIEAEAKANDPGKLKSEIVALRNEKASLERQVVAAAAAKPPVMKKGDLKAAEKRAVAEAKKEFAPLLAALEAAMKFIIEINAKGFFDAGGDAVDKKAVEKVFADAGKEIAAIVKAHVGAREKQLTTLQAHGERLVKQLAALLEKKDVTIKLDVQHNKPFTIAPAPARSVSRVTPSGPATIAEGLTKTQQAILDALAWIEAMGLKEPPRMMVAYLSDSSPKSSTFEKYVSQLRTAGYITTGATFRLTDAGRVIANAPDAPPDHETMMVKIGQKLTPGQLAIVGAATAVYPSTISREDLAKNAGSSPTSSTFEKYLSQAKSLGLIKQPEKGFLRAADVLFPERMAA